MLEHRSLLAPAALGSPVSPPLRHLYCSPLCLPPPLHLQLLQCRGPTGPRPLPSLGSAEAISPCHTAAITTSRHLPCCVSRFQTHLPVSEATQSLGSSRIPGDWSPKAAPASHLRSPLLLSHPVSITGSLCTSQPRPRHSGPIPGSRLPQPSACNPSLNLGSDHFPHPLATTGTSRLDYGSCPLAGLPSPTRVPLSAPHTGARGVFPKL